MSISTSTIEAVAAAYLEKEFCTDAPAIQKFINNVKAGAATADNIFKKEEHLIAAGIMQAFYDGVNTIAGCPDTTEAPAQ